MSVKVSLVLNYRLTRVSKGFHSSNEGSSEPHKSAGRKFLIFYGLNFESSHGFSRLEPKDFWV